MTFFRPTIDRLRVEGFRGFRDAREFDLSASAVIVTGPNGTGKTSFFDALQWVLLGRIERLETLRARKNVEHIVSRYRAGRKATVEIDLHLASGRVTARRTGDQGGSTLELIRDGQPTRYGDEAEAELRRLLVPSHGLTLESALTTSGLMQQDILRSVLEARPAERYKQLSTILGLGRLEAFEEATKAASADAAEREKRARMEFDAATLATKQARDRLEISRIRLSSRPQIGAMRSEALEQLLTSPEGVIVNAELIRLEHPEDVQNLAASYAKRGKEIEALISGSEGLSVLERTNVSVTETLDELDRELEQRTQERAAAELLRDEAQSRLNTARQVAADMAKLASLAVPLLSNQCPVCGQSIDPSHVERELLAKADGTGILLELETSFANAHNAWVAAGTAVTAAEEAHAEAERDRRRVDEIERLRASVTDSIHALRDPRSIFYLDAHHIENGMTEISHLAQVAAEYVRSARQPLYDLLDAFDRHADQQVLERAEAELSSSVIEHEAVEAQLNAATTRARKMKDLANATVEARVEVTERRLRSIQPLVADIYHRLDPHPSFKTVDFELDTYYRRGTTSPLVVDPVAGVTADPLLVFSTSQANIVALSYFLSMSLSMGADGLSFLLLDDPVQSMDDVNVLGFSDLCRHLREDRQLIVSTHERRLSGLLERKLAPRHESETTRIIRFSGWDRSGPTVDEKLVRGGAFDSPVVVLPTAS